VTASPFFLSSFFSWGFCVCFLGGVLLVSCRVWFGGLVFLLVLCRLFVWVCVFVVVGGVGVSWLCLFRGGGLFLSLGVSCLGFGGVVVLGCGVFFWFIRSVVRERGREGRWTTLLPPFFFNSSVPWSVREGTKDVRTVFVRGREGREGRCTTLLSPFFF